MLREIDGLKVLMLEDNPNDTELILAELNKAGLSFVWKRVWTESDFRKELKEFQSDLVISDFSLGQFTALDALEIIKEENIQVPFILVTGSQGEETAVECIKAGVADYILKSSLVRLPTAVRNVLRARMQAIELERAQEQYRLLLQSTGEGIYGIDTEGCCTFINNAAAQLLGDQPTDLIGRKIHDLIHHSHQDGKRYLREDCPIIISSKTGDHCRVDDEVFWRSDGTFFPVEYSVYPIMNSGAVGAVVVFSDITQRKAAEESLRESEERYRKLFEANPLPMWVYDLESLAFLAVNESAVSHYGYSREEFLSMTIKDIRPSEDVAALMENLQRAQVGLENAGFWRHRRKDGSILEVEITSHGLLFFGKNARLVLAKDITERRRTEEALLESEYRFRQIAENISEVFWMSDRELGKILYVSPAYETIWARTCQSLYESPTSFAEAIHPEDREAAMNELRKQIIRDGFDHEYRIVRPDGAIRWIWNRCFPIRNQDRETIRIVGIAQDITERKHAEVERQDLERQLLQAQKMEAIGQLAGGVAHDFNNLLMAVSSYSELLLMKLNEQDELRQVADEIRKVGLQGANLTRQLLAFSRKQVLSPKILDLRESTVKMQNMLERLIGEDVQMVFLFEEGLGFINADPSQIEQIIMNLVVNARDAMPQGGKLTIEVSNVDLDGANSAVHASVTPGRYVLLSVSDTGSGMDEHTLSRIFEPFFTTKGEGQGTGLGLSTVYGIVKQSGGHIWVYSQVGHGTTFKIHFPRVDAPAVFESSETSYLDVTGHDKVILLVDDNESVRCAVASFLELKGFTVWQAGNGKQAIRMALEKEERVDLVITDVVMPEMGGRELAERLSKEYPALKVLYMSGYTEEAIKRHGILDPRTAFLSKPAPMQALLQKIAELLQT